MRHSASMSLTPSNWGFINLMLFCDSVCLDVCFTDFQNTAVGQRFMFYLESWLSIQITHRGKPLRPDTSWINHKLMVFQRSLFCKIPMIFSPLTYQPISVISRNDSMLLAEYENRKRIWISKCPPIPRYAFWQLKHNCFSNRFVWYMYVL